MSTPEQVEHRAANVKAEAAAALRQETQQTRDQQAPASANLQTLSPRTKLPIEHPESQAVERIHYEMQQSLASATPPAEVEAFFKKAESKDG